MKRWLAIAACLLIDGATAHYALAQRSTVHAHTATAQGAAGYLGVGVAEIDDEVAKTLNLKEDHGVVVMNVSENSAAAKAGLKQSDVIVEFNGQRVEGVEQFMRLVRETPPERKVTLQIHRAGAAQTLEAVLTARTRSQLGNFEFQMPEMGNFPELSIPPAPPALYMPDTPHAVLSWQQGAIGIEAEPVNGQLADFFGVKEGVLVRAVTPDSPADKAGLKAGDVVVRVGSNGVRSPQDISRELRPVRRTKGNVMLAVVRNRHEMSVSIRPGGAD